MSKKETIIGMAVIGALGFAPYAGAETLHDAVIQAVKTNPDVQASLNEVRAREQEVTQAKAGYYPTVDLSAATGMENTDSPTTRAAGNDGYVSMIRREASIVARQNIYAGMATVNNSERQQARLNAAKYNLQSDMQGVALESAKAYLDVIRREHQLELANDYLKAHQEVMGLVRRRTSSGLGRAADMEQMQGRLAQARSAVIEARRDLEIARANYNRIIGSAPAEPMAISSPGAAELPASLSEAERMAMSQHPALHSASADVDASQKQLAGASSSFRPQVDVVAKNMWGNDLDGVDGEDKRYSLMLEANYNLLNGGGDAARKREYGYRVEQATQLKSSTERKVLEGVRLAWNAYESSKEQIDYLKQHADASKKARDAYIKQFNIGRRTLLDVLDTEKELYESRRAYETGKYELAYAQYRVLAGTGALNRYMGVVAQTSATDNRQAGN